MLEVVSSKISSELSTQTVNIIKQAHPIASKSKQQVELGGQGRSTQGRDGRQEIGGKSFLSPTPLFHSLAVSCPGPHHCCPRLTPAFIPAAPLGHLHELCPLIL